MKHFSVQSGYATPFGSEPKEGGVNFSVFSEHATAIFLCLFDGSGQKEIQRIAMCEGENSCWHVFVEGLKVGAKYGYRADGPYLPEHGHRFNINKLLIDPYARALDREFEWDDSLYGFDERHPERDLTLSNTNNISIIPKSVVTDRATAHQIEAIQLKKPSIPWQDMVVYETHVRGFSQLNRQVPPDLRGTLAGLSHKVSIDYFKRLGVTSIELLPVHSFIDEAFLVKQGLTNYWGYNTANFFIPHNRYLSSDEGNEFLTAVEKLHAAGLEVILDVVYNHTAESNRLGPTLSLRGLDNRSYYRLEDSSARYYVNDTGCGNTIRAEHPRVMQMILDSLRFWAGEMGVDGFRFDLASILGRDEKGFNGRAAFFQAISQDPLLSKCKMIAEPWDIGPGGYQLGAYPGEWSEWNDQYRDICRRFWRGDAGILPEFARRIHGSGDVFESSGRSPRASLNFICSHDGFTLRDLVSYRQRHNLANKEDNRDGHGTNFSENYGVEGETDNTEIEAVRWRQQRNLLATMFLSQGTPMLLGGDEFGRTQGGNNNAYCQDNDINWFDWSIQTAEQASLIDFTALVTGIRQKYSVLRSNRYIHQPEDFLEESRCARWVSKSGMPMQPEDWADGNSKSVGWLLETMEDNTNRLLLMVFNAHAKAVEFKLPEEQGVHYWRALVDTYINNGKPLKSKIESESTVAMEARTLKLFVAVRDI